MITTYTYRDQIGVAQDLLAAYSALDHRTTADLPSEEVDVAFRRLLPRLSTLLFLHGPDVPGQFLEALGLLSDDADPVNLAAAFMETGKSTEDGHVAASELQQEVVHFSRIVDIGTLGLNDGNAHRTVRRLRNSRNVPDTLKVLSELIIVARSRMLQRGLTVTLPWLRPRPANEQELDAVTTLWAPAEEDYVLAVASPRRRTRKDVGYLFTCLLSYLTPTEAVLALWAHACGEKLHAWLEVTLVSVAPDQSPLAVSWSHPGGDISHSTHRPIAWCRSHLPAPRALPDGQTTEWITVQGGVRVTVKPISDQVSVSVTGPDRAVYSTVLGAAPSGVAASVTDMAARARELINDYDGPEILSIECGHIHLDRDLDIDQEVGAVLGSQAMKILTQRQTRSPALTPMMDDDHVLVKLHPANYRAFLDSHFPHEPMHLIAESSPIVRSIVCALWARLRHLGLDGRCRERGQNLFLELDNGNYCELFEDFSGDAITGCVFFELGLLVYRSAPAQFDEYFRVRFAQEQGVHEQACTILDGIQEHDDKIARLQEFYAVFSAVTDPRHPDTAVAALVDDVIESARDIAHLNVLEDYYEIQQDKVRILIGLLELPMRLITVHFNAHTGRVVLDG